MPRNPYPNTTLNMKGFDQTASVAPRSATRLARPAPPQASFYGDPSQRAHARREVHPRGRRLLAAAAQMATPPPAGWVRDRSSRRSASRRATAGSRPLGDAGWGAATGAADADAPTSSAGGSTAGQLALEPPPMKPFNPGGTDVAVFHRPGDGEDAAGDRRGRTSPDAWVAMIPDPAKANLGAAQGGAASVPFPAGPLPPGPGVQAGRFTPTAG